MKLYEVPRNTRIRVVEPEAPPPGGLPAHAGEVLKFVKIDGMYSYCLDEQGNAVHLKAWTEVEIVQ
jgi:hypothetical protein